MSKDIELRLAAIERLIAQINYNQSGMLRKLCEKLGIEPVPPSESQEAKSLNEPPQLSADDSPEAVF